MPTARQNQTEETLLSEEKKKDKEETGFFIKTIANKLKL
jgi:hypothetical protein